MSVTLINPCTNYRRMPPLGLLYVASYLEKNGVSVDVIDPFSDGKEYKTDSKYVGITCMSNQWDFVKDVAKTIKTQNSGSIVVVGGVHPTVSKTSDENVDIYVVGEGEKAMLRIVKEGIKKGIVEGEPFKNIDERPFPARHLINMKKYTQRSEVMFFNWIRATTMITSLGCPHDCIYCINSKRAMFGKTVRYNSAEYVEREVEEITSKYKIDGIHFVDDNFVSWKKRAMDICKRIKKYDLKWHCESRVDTIDRELLVEMKNAGCVSLAFGIESGSPKVLKAINKRANIEETIRAFDLCHEYKLKTLAQMIIGSPEETVDDIKLTEKLLDRISPDYVLMSFMTPYEGTVMYDMALEKGWPMNPSKLASDEPQVEINFSFQELAEIGKRIRRKYNPFIKSVKPYLNKYFFYDMLKLLGKKPSLITKRTSEWLEASRLYL